MYAGHVFARFGLEWRYRHESYTLCGLGAGLLIGLASAQPPDPQPIYRVTVVSRSLEAVNYEHRGGPSPLDFQGTVLLPHAKGTAIVESHRGSVAIDAKFEHLEAPTQFGREYLTYVLWAISPEGRPRNLGEVLVDSSNKAHVKVTTDLQAFGLMVTAEPYYSVSIPSDVVVAENVVRPDTIGGARRSDGEIRIDAARPIYDEHSAVPAAFVQRRGGEAVL